jgi:hypothetical protein
VWANSKGVVAQAHYDIEGVIFVEVYGRKKFTFWHPKDLSRMCLHPYGCEFA